MNNDFSHNEPKATLIKLHLGCGTNYMPGWINIDNNSDNNIHQLDMLHDLRQPFPIKDNTVDFIFSEHVFEHLEVSEGIQFAKECLRVLKPEGVARFAMPDISAAVALYNDPDWRQKTTLPQHGIDVKTSCELLNINMRWWGHKWMYNWEELERRLTEAGCMNLLRRKPGQSKHPELQRLETRNESALIVEITK